MKTDANMYKIFHTLVPRDGMNMTAAEAARFALAWDDFAATLADLASNSDGFRFYTRTPRTEPAPLSGPPSDLRYRYEAVDVLAFDTLHNAASFKDVACKLETDFLDSSSAWLLCKERVAVNGAQKGPLDTGRGLRVITSMRRRPGMEPSAFRRHWGDHALNVIATQGISRYVANPLVDAEYESAQPPVDGFVEAWFRTADDAHACFTDPMMTGAQQEHNAAFIDTRTFFTIRCMDRERWVRGERAHAAALRRT